MPADSLPESVVEPVFALRWSPRLLPLFVLIAWLAAWPSAAPSASDQSPGSSAAPTAPTAPAGSADTSRSSGRFFRPEPGFLRPVDLPDTLRAPVDSIFIDVKDAFEGSDAHSKAERWVFSVGNKIHIESRPATIRRRLLFKTGDTLSRGLLLESERALRGEPFLADAILEVGPDRQGARAVKVTVYDQWTTVVWPTFSSPDLSASDLLPSNWGNLSDNEWIYGIGVWEMNFLGTGTKVGGTYRHDLQRNTLEFGLSNNAITRFNVQGSLYAANLSDGHAYQAKLGKPLRSREDRRSFATELSSFQLSEFYYFDANRLDELPPKEADSLAGEDHLLREYKRVSTDTVLLEYTRSYGRRTKLSLGPSFLWQDRYQDSVSSDEAPALNAAFPLPPSALEPELRTDALLGADFSVYQYAITTARNFRNLKWNETVTTGWRFNLRAALNQEWLGAGNAFPWAGGDAIAGQVWKDRFFASCSLSTQTFFKTSGGFLDGRVDGASEIQWKPVPITSTVLHASWNNYFATPQSRQLLLGASDGLVGYPSFYYAGQARFLAAAEQRYFPEFEALTFVAAFTGFVVAGNTFPAWSDFDPADLHWAIGAGLRLGRSKSTTKSVQHINLSLPVGDEFLKGPSLSILVRNTL
jgi:hypothetical protein